MANSSTAEPASFIAIPDDIRAFIDDIRFATISTINPDGSPWQAVVWYTVDDDEIVLNSKVGRRWPNNLLRDQRIAFSVIDDADGDRWIGLNGLVTVVEDQATAQALHVGQVVCCDQSWRPNRISRSAGSRLGAASGS